MPTHSDEALEAARAQLLRDEARVSSLELERQALQSQARDPASPVDPNAVHLAELSAKIAASQANVIQSIIRTAEAEQMQAQTNTASLATPHDVKSQADEFKHGYEQS